MKTRLESSTVALACLVGAGLLLGMGAACAQAGDEESYQDRIAREVAELQRYLQGVSERQEDVTAQLKSMVEKRQEEAVEAAKQMYGEAAKAFAEQRKEFDQRLDETQKGMEARTRELAELTRRMIDEALDRARAEWQERAERAEAERMELENQRRIEAERMEKDRQMAAEAELQQMERRETGERERTQAAHRREAEVRERAEVGRERAEAEHQDMARREKANIVSRVLHVEHVETKALVELLGPMYDVQLASNPQLGIIAVRGPAEAVEAFLAEAARLDVAPAPTKNLLLRFHVIGAGEHLDGGGDVLAEGPLAKVAAELRETFSYRGWRVLNTMLVRTRDGGQAACTDTFKAGEQSASVSIKVSGVVLNPDGHTVRLDRLGALVNAQTGSTEIEAQADVPLGRATLLGKGGLGGDPVEAVFLVVEATLVD